MSTWSLLILYYTYPKIWKKNTVEKDTELKKKNRPNCYANYCTYKEKKTTPIWLFANLPCDFAVDVVGTQYFHFDTCWDVKKFVKTFVRMSLT